jgi:hypothetical protein
MKSTVLQSVGSFAMLPVSWLSSLFVHFLSKRSIERARYCSLVRQFRQKNEGSLVYIACNYAH